MSEAKYETPGIDVPQTAPAAGIESAPAIAESAADATGESGIEDRVVAALREIFDPEIPVNIYDLGLIYNIAVPTPGAVNVTMTLTSPNCPVAESLPEEVRQKVAGVDGVKESNIEITWEPPWSPELMTEAAKLELNMFGF